MIDLFSLQLKLNYCFNSFSTRACVIFALLLLLCDLCRPFCFIYFPCPLGCMRQLSNANAKVASKRKKNQKKENSSKQIKILKQQEQ